MPKRLGGSVCPFCGSGEYGDNEESPIGYDCGSGYMTDENLPEDFSQSTGCVIIRGLLEVPREIVAWLKSDPFDDSEGEEWLGLAADAIVRGEYKENK